MQAMRLLIGLLEKSAPPADFPIELPQMIIYPPEGPEPPTPPIFGQENEGED
jgi:hypothetical protein